MHLTPYLTLVLAGFALFVSVLGVEWARSYMSWTRADKEKP